MSEVLVARRAGVSLGRQLDPGSKRSIVPPVLMLLGLVLPTEISGASLTPGRLGLILLLPLALSVMFARGRRLLVSDFFVFATAAWMIAAAVVVDGLVVLWEAPAGEALEFAGAYIAARAFIFGPSALATFMRVLRCAVVLVVAFALADTFSSRMFLHETVSGLTGVPTAVTPFFRVNLVRATSTFEHSILFGAFCSIFATMTMYSDGKALVRFLFVVIAFVGAVISLTSVALLSFFLGLGLYTYDQLLWRHPWRWSVAAGIVALLICVVLAVTNAPLGWIVTHLTFDAETGYFRYMIWEAATIYIGQSPLFGYAYRLLHHDILDHTVDCVWLVTSLHYGLPAMLLLLLANVTACLPVRLQGNDLQSQRNANGFAVILGLFMFIGLTVHFWNFMWVFWGLCIGIRASLREWRIAMKESGRGAMRFARV
jgi:hypothetical protein